MKTHDPLLFALVKCYDKHRGYFYLNNYQSFKLFANWYLGEAVGTEYIGTPLPWYRQSYELSQLAKILKCSDAQLLGMLEEICDGY